MFDSKKKARPAELATLVGRETEIRGGIVFRGALHVEGRVKGDISAAIDDDGALLTVGEHGVVEGEVRVPRLSVNGTVTGNVFSSQIVELASLAKITGNIHYVRLEMALGAEVNGQLIPDRPADLPAESGLVQSDDANGSNS